MPSLPFTPASFLPFETGSSVLQFAGDPPLLGDDGAAGLVGGRKLTVALPFHVRAGDSAVGPALRLGEIPVFDVHVPRTLPNFVLRFADVAPFSVLFVVAVIPFVNVAVGVGQRSETADFVVLEGAFVKLAGARQRQPTFAVLAAVSEVAGVFVAVAVRQFAFAFEAVAAEFAFVRFVFEGVSPAALLFVPHEFAEVNRSAGL